MLACWTLLYVFWSHAVAIAQPQGSTGFDSRSPKLTRVGPQSRRSDVFLITIDTLRADHVGCYGYGRIQTRTLDNLANDGIRFANAFTPSPITNTSHASILTGLLPSSHGVTDFGIPIAPDALTLAQLMKEDGYATAAFIGAIILDSKALAPGFDRGFDYYDSFPADPPKTTSRYVRLERRGMDVVHRAESWLLKHSGGQRRFMWVHLYDPHDPYDPPPPYDREYAGHLYDGEIAYADSALGHFVALLKKQRIYDRSLIIVVGDHGEGLGEHGEQTHGIFLYNATTQVPLLLKLPRPQSAENRPPINPRGLVVTTQVRTLDIFPTILELEAINLPKHLDGVSLRPLWFNQKILAANDRGSADKPSAPVERIVFGETDYPVRFGWAPLRSVSAGGAKYIEAPRPEFYDLRADPQESQNIYEPWNESVQKLRAMLAELRNTTVSHQEEAAAVSRRSIEQLRALGYLRSTPGSTTAAKPSLLPDPKDKIEAHNFIHAAMLAGEEGNTKAARKALEGALRVDPRSAVALTQLGEFELAQGNYKRAVDLLARSRQIRPEDAATVIDEARARYASSDVRGARDVLEASQSITTGGFEAHYLLGKIYAGLRERDKAEDQLEAAIFLNPNKPEARVELARLLVEQNHPAEALQQLRQAAQLSPRSPEIFDLMSQAYLREGERAAAQRAAARAKTLKSRLHHAPSLSGERGRSEARSRRPHHKSGSVKTAEADKEAF